MGIYAPVTQWLEYRAVNAEVGGSIPSGSVFFFHYLMRISHTIDFCLKYLMINKYERSADQNY